MIYSQSTRLIAGALWRAIAVVFLVFLGLEFVFRLMDELKSPHTSYLLGDMLWVTILGLPRRLYLDLPLITLVAVAAGLGALAQQSALTVLRASGLSIVQILQKALVSLSPLLIATLIVAQVGVPQAEEAAQRIKEVATRGESATAIWTRDGDRFVWLHGGADGAVTRWRHLVIDPATRRLSTLVESESASLDDGLTVLDSATRLSFTGQSITAANQPMALDTGLTASGVRWLILPPDQLSLVELRAARAWLIDQGLDARSHEQLFWQRMTLPLTLVVLALFAAVTAFGSYRSLALSSRVFIAIFAGLVFKYLVDIAAPLTLLAGWHPSLAVLVPLALPLALIPRIARH